MGKEVVVMIMINKLKIFHEILYYRMYKLSKKMHGNDIYVHHHASVIVSAIHLAHFYLIVVALIFFDIYLDFFFKMLIEHKYILLVFFGL